MPDKEGRHRRKASPRTPQKEMKYEEASESRSPAYGKDCAGATKSTSSMSLLSKVRLPGKVTFVVLGCCLCLVFLDAACLLGHPISNPFVDDSEQPQHCLASADVRERYNERLAAWEQ